jgi:hypothetical protein
MFFGRNINYYFTDYFGMGGDDATSSTDQKMKNEFYRNFPKTS